MTPRNRRINVALEIEKGEAAFRQAVILRDSDEFDGAISRAYYAVFHYAQALLLSKGLEAGSHQGLNRLFGLHFVRTGAFEKRFSTILSHAQKAREESDYSPEIPFASDEADERLTEAREFISEMRAFLKHKGYLKG